MNRKEALAAKQKHDEEQNAAAAQESASHGKRIQELEEGLAALKAIVAASLGVVVD